MKERNNKQFWLLMLGMAIAITTFALSLHKVENNLHKREKLNKYDK